MALSSPESRLLSALSEYLGIANQGRTASTQAAWAETLKRSILTLDTLESELAPLLDPRLRHFLESKSYRKAHDHLSARASSGLANSPAARQPCSG